MVRLFPCSEFIYVELSSDDTDSAEDLERKIQELRKIPNLKSTVMTIGSDHPASRSSDENQGNPRVFSEDHKNQICALMKLFPCKRLSVSAFSDEEVNHMFKDIIREAIPTCDVLFLGYSLSDGVIQTLHDSLETRGGVEHLILNHIRVSETALALLGQTTLGNRKDKSHVEFRSHDRPLAQRRIVPLLKNLNGFKQVELDVHFDTWPITVIQYGWIALGEILSSDACAISTLIINSSEVGQLNSEHRLDKLKPMLEAITTNRSLTSLQLFDSNFTQRELSFIAGNVAKFSNLKDLSIGTFCTSLEFLRPMLAIASIPRIIPLKSIKLQGKNVTVLSNEDENILERLFNFYPSLWSIKGVLISPTLAQRLQARSKWLEFIEASSQKKKDYDSYGRSLGLLLLVAVKTEQSEEDVGYIGAINASIRYSIVKDIVAYGFLKISSLKRKREDEE